MKCSFPLFVLIKDKVMFDRDVLLSFFFFLNQRPTSPYKREIEKLVERFKEVRGSQSAVNYFTFMQLCLS